MTGNCVFCDILSGSISSDILYRDDYCFAIRDINPKAPVHILVIPNNHFTFLYDLNPTEHPMIGAMFQCAKKLAEAQGLEGTGYRLVVNQGSDSGQMVDHLHLHLLGGENLGAMNTSN